MILICLIISCTGNKLDVAAKRIFKEQEEARLLFEQQQSVDKEKRECRENQELESALVEKNKRKLEEEILKKAKEAKIESDLSKISKALKDRASSSNLSHLTSEHICTPVKKGKNAEDKNLYEGNIIHCAILEFKLDSLKTLNWKNITAEEINNLFSVKSSRQGHSCLSLAFYAYRIELNQSEKTEEELIKELNEMLKLLLENKLNLNNLITDISLDAVAVPNFVACWKNFNLINESIWKTYLLKKEFLTHYKKRGNILFEPKTILHYLSELEEHVIESNKEKFKMIVNSSIDIYPEILSQKYMDKNPLEYAKEKKSKILEKIISNRVETPLKKTSSKSNIRNDGTNSIASESGRKKPSSFLKTGKETLV